MINIVTTVGPILMDDSSWGRLYKFNTSGNTGLVLPPRAYYFRPFFSGGWTDLAIGLIYGSCGNDGDLSDINDERIEGTSPTNLFHFGLTKTEGSPFDVNANPNFLGIRGILNGNTQINSSPLQLGVMQLTRIYNEQVGQSGQPVIMPLTQGVSDTPFAMIGLRFTFEPTTNLVYANFDSNPSVALVDDTADVSTLKTFMDAIPNTQATAISSFFIEDTANLSSYYLYWPYMTNRLTLYTVGAEKYG